ncbi:MAG: clan AA aspartic protease [Chloroflexota bacterium]|nr:clan AA aspartic protease [Chloroflexota bacterium]
MIEGRINHRYEPVVNITIVSPTGQTRELEAVVDTGFNGFIILPADLVEELELPFLNSSQAFLADDREVNVQVHQATLTWDGARRRVRATASGTTALVGMQLMTDHRLEMDIRIDGTVRIRSP